MSDHEATAESCHSPPQGLANLAGAHPAMQRARMLVVYISCLNLLQPFTALGDTDSTYATQVLSAGDDAPADGEWVPAPEPVPPLDTEDNAGVAGDFPALPPSPEDVEPLPPLFDELWHHGGSYLYQPEGDRLGWPQPTDESSHELLRLPESWVEPRPWTAFSEFLGADPIQASPRGWLLPPGYFNDHRFTLYGSYSLFGFANQQSNRRQDALGHQLIVEADHRLSGTERFHVQFRPLGRRDTGGSFYQFNDPAGYTDNSTGVPDRYWFEGEWHSLLGPDLDPYAQHYVNFVVGKFPFLMHNSLLMNDDVLGFVVSKNNVLLGNTSNLNVQLLAAFDDVDTYAGRKSAVYGLHATLDYQRSFIEATYAFVSTDFDRDAHFLGISGTKPYGPLNVAARALFKHGDAAGTGSAQLFALESNYAVVFEKACWGVEHAVYFCNAFWASEGWNSIAGGNFNRLRTAFVVNPLVRLAAGPAADDVCGVAAGIQLFRHHDDQSLIPEVAWEAPGGRSVIGFGLRYQSRTGPRSFLEVLGVVNESDDRRFDRDGVFVSHSWVF